MIPRPTLSMTPSPRDTTEPLGRARASRRVEPVTEPTAPFDVSRLSEALRSVYVSDRAPRPTDRPNEPSASFWGGRRPVERTGGIVWTPRLVRSLRWEALRCELSRAAQLPVTVRLPLVSNKDPQKWMSALSRAAQRVTVRLAESRGNVPTHKLRYLVTIVLSEDVELKCEWGGARQVDLTVARDTLASEANFRRLALFLEDVSRSLEQRVELRSGDEAFCCASRDSAYELEWLSRHRQTNSPGK